MRLGLLAVVIWLIATRLSLHEIVGAFAELRAVYLIPVVVILLPLTVLLRSARWRWLLPAGQHLPLSSYVTAYLVGNLANSLLLGKLGDLVKARLICDSRVDYGHSIAATLIDRLVEGTALLLIFAGALMTSSLPGWAYQLAGLAGTVAIGALVTLRLAVHHKEWLLSTAGRAFCRLPERLSDKLLAFPRRLLAGCDVLADYRRLLVAFAYALAVWGIEVAIVIMFLAAFSISAPWVLAAVVLIVVVNFGMLVPISPGSVGIYQLLCAFALSLWGVDRGLGFALGIAMQTITYVPLYLAGLAAMMLLRRNEGKKRESAPVVARMTGL